MFVSRRFFVWHVCMSIKAGSKGILWQLCTQPHPGCFGGSFGDVGRGVCQRKGTESELHPPQVQIEFYGVSLLNWNKRKVGRLKPRNENRMEQRKSLTTTPLSCTLLPSTWLDPPESMLQRQVLGEVGFQVWGQGSLLPSRVPFGEESIRHWGGIVGIQPHLYKEVAIKASGKSTNVSHVGPRVPDQQSSDFA